MGIRDIQLPKNALIVILLIVALAIYMPQVIILMIVIYLIVTLYEWRKAGGRITR